MICGVSCGGVIPNLEPGRQHPFARGIKQCSVIVELQWGMRAKNIAIERSTAMKIPTTRRYSRRSFSILLGAAPVLAAGMQASAQIPEVSAAPPSDETDARELAIEAYIYAYPLVTMEYTRRVMTNTVKPEGTHAPMGQFANLREYPTAAFKEVTAPNADTLYSAAWLDLSREPVILHVPDERGRYYLMPARRLD